MNHDNRASGDSGAAIGQPAARFGGFDRVTGRQRYVADIPLDGVLHVKLVTVDHAHARIVGIDTAAALAVPGVVAVLTAADLPQPVPRHGPQFKDRPVIAVDAVHYHGEPVAAVAAETLDAAEEGARRVHVEVEPLAAVTSIADALAADAPLVQDPSLRPGDPLNATNVLREHRYAWGDSIEDAEPRADVVVEGTYTFPMVTQFAIEPHAFAAAPDGDGGVAIWSAIQHPYWLQRIMAGTLGLPLAKVRIFAPDPGGAFGGKQHAKYEPLLAFLALRVGRPVRLVLTLEETFQAVRRGASEVHVRTGFAMDGSVVFRDIRADYLIGAYADIADRTVSKGSYTSVGPYRTPAVRIVSRTILSNTVPSTAFRGFGNPQQIWAVESNMNEAARTLGIDPVDLRLRNLAREGEVFIEGDTPADGDWAATVRRAAELIGWDTPASAGRGRGIAVGMKSGPTTGLSYATVRLLADGSAILYSGTSDMGQGARTIFAQLVSDELGVPLDRISVVMGDTAVVPYDQQTSASRSTVIMGRAVQNACRDLVATVRQRATERLGPDALTLDLSLTELATRTLGPQGGEFIGNGEQRKAAEPNHVLGGTAAFFEFNCTAVEVEVDRDTGDVTVTRHVSVSDVGKALNPSQVRGQDEGAAIMGLGHTLMEQLVLDDTGRIRNLGAIDYRIPTSMDLPHVMTSDAIENGDGPGPHGAKGMSEGGLLCVAPAVAAAVRDATGVAFHELPLTPERVWRGLRAAEATEATEATEVAEVAEIAGAATAGVAPTDATPTAGPAPTADIDTAAGSPTPAKVVVR
jgi:CO/xanthine dehydrogenase Mo-binding subunit